MKATSGNRGLLLVVTWGTLLFGATLVLAPSLTRQGFALMIYGDSNRVDAFGPDAVAYITLMHGVLGATMVGWSVALLNMLRAQPPGALAIVAFSVGAWFVVDTLFSLALGFWQNAVLNAVFGALFGAGLWAARVPRA